MSAEEGGLQSSYVFETAEGLSEFYAECRELAIPAVQYIAELPGEYATNAECQLCQSQTPAQFLINHDSLERRVHAECCADHAHGIVRDIGGHTSGTRIDEERHQDSQQTMLSVQWAGGAEQEVKQ